jgi:hypothetical protein
MRLSGILLMAIALVLAPVIALPTAAHAQPYDANAPCGRDANGYALQCTQENASANIQAACTTTGRPENCVPYHQNACLRGVQQACALYNLGRNCFGGDPNVCNYYLQLIHANTACAMDRDQGACAWLQQQQY